MTDKKMLVWIGCEDRMAREEATGLITNMLSSAQRDSERPLHAVTTISVQNSPIKAGSLLTIMEEFRPGFTNRMTTVLHPRAELAIEHLEPESISPKVQQFIKEHVRNELLDAATRISDATQQLMIAKRCENAETMGGFVDKALRCLRPEVVTEKAS